MDGPNLMEGLSIKTYMTPDDMPKSLRAYCTTDPDATVFPHWFKHPFYISMFPLMFPTDVEQIIALRKARADEALAKKNYGTYIGAYERAFRFGVLLDLADSIDFARSKTSARKFWDLAGWVWRDSEIDESDPYWTRLMDLSIPEQEYMSCGRGRRLWQAFPDMVRVFRGVQAQSLAGARRATGQGWSWSTSTHVGSFFATRLIRSSDRPYLATGFVRKEDIRGYFLQRAEAEVLIRPGTKITDLTVGTTEAPPQGWREGPSARRRRKGVPDEEWVD